MKGLLLKDWYMMKQYCRFYLVCGIGFIALSVMSSGNMFFVFYPCLLCGMIPVNLIGYDERSRWMQYSLALPYTRRQIVSGKYLMGLFSLLAVWILVGIAQGGKILRRPSADWGEFAVIMLLMLIVSMISSAIALPFVFKLGVEKGRSAYYGMVGFVCGASVLATGFFRDRLAMEIKPNLLLVILAVMGIGIYIISWYLSVVFFKKREIG